MQPTSPADRSLQNRRVWLAPICLCLVAALHLWRVTSAGQTPWKGGGFGMFSTIDAEHARYVRAWLVTPTGERPIVIPHDLEKKVAELRAAPNAAELQVLTQRLLQRTWIDARWEQQQIAEQMQQEQQDQPLNAERWQALRKAATSVVAANERTSTTPVIAQHPTQAEEASLPFTAIRAEVWKYEMTAGTSTLQAKRLLATTAAVEDRGP